MVTRGAICFFQTARVKLNNAHKTTSKGIFNRQTISTPQFSRSFFLNTSLNEEEEIMEPKVTLPKIYTKTGDKGMSSLFTGERRQKSDFIFETLGDVDEVTSHVGLSKNRMMESWQEENFKDIALQFEKIQCTLQDVNSCIATPLSSATEARLDRTKLDEGLTEELEEWIDFYISETPPLKNFILPSGGAAASHIHVTRSVCRRAERKVTSLVASGEIPEGVGKYMNRLSDYFFMVARYIAMMEGHVEKVYKKPKRKKDVVEEKINDKLEEA